MEDSSFSSFPMANWTTRVGGPAGGIFETNAAALVTEQPSPNFASPHTPVGQINLGGGADWDIGSEPPVVTDNKHIVIPLMSFVFGFPVLVITVLCVIQQRNKWLYERQHLRLQQQRRFSTASTIFTGYPTTTRALPGSIQPKDIAIFGHGRDSVVFNNNDSPLSATYSHRDSVTLQTLQQNGILVTPNSSSGQRSRKQSGGIRFTEAVTDEEDARAMTVPLDRRGSIYLHPSYNANTRSPLLNVGPQNIMDKFGYVDA